MEKTYVPSQKLLKRYAEVLVNVALNSGAGVKKGEVVQCVVPDIAKPLLIELQNAILRAGAHPMLRMIPSGTDRSFFELANESQLKFFPKDYMKARVDVIDHQIAIIADEDPRELQKVDPKKIILARDSKKEYRDWITDKETQGKFTWTLALWGTQAKADETGMSLEEYWDQIIKACFLDKTDAVSRWKTLLRDQEKLLAKMNAMEFESLHITGPDADLKIRLGADKIWNGGTGRNIPSFEVFTSPDWRGTEGWIRFNQPLYRYGNVLQDIYLEFKDGIVVKAKAKKGNKLLQQMLQSKNADKVGEYSLTDKRLSRITKVMAETLFDENIGGPFGNTHLAIGMAYKDCYRGDKSKLTAAEWDKLGFNDSAEHTDIISTTDRTVVATLTNGKEFTLYKKGMFTLF